MSGTDVLPPNVVFVDSRPSTQYDSKCVNDGHPLIMQRERYKPGYMTRANTTKLGFRNINTVYGVDEVYRCIQDTSKPSGIKIHTCPCSCTYYTIDKFPGKYYLRFESCIKALNSYYEQYGVTIKLTVTLGLTKDVPQKYTVKFAVNGHTFLTYQDVDKYIELIMTTYRIEQTKEGFTCRGFERMDDDFDTFSKSQIYEISVEDMKLLKQLQRPTVKLSTLVSRMNQFILSVFGYLCIYRDESMWFEPTDASVYECSYIDYWSAIVPFMQNKFNILNK